MSPGRNARNLSRVLDWCPSVPFQEDREVGAAGSLLGCRGAYQFLSAFSACTIFFPFRNDVLYSPHGWLRVYLYLFLVVANSFTNGVNAYGFALASLQLLHVLSYIAKVWLTFRYSRLHPDPFNCAYVS